ncbi:adenosine deaminase [Acetobacteraceae bacterium]|nr:adenosine deaminase [Acetobacteraceae bacterium]
MMDFSQKLRCRFWGVFSFTAFCLGIFSFSPVAFSETAVKFPAALPLGQAVLDEKAKNPQLLSVFLQDFPKGSDLHNHLIGAVYAESFLNWAEADGNCLDLTTNTILPNSCPKKDSKKFESAVKLFDQPERREALIDLMSMRHFRPHATFETGHDHFFAAFQHLGLRPDRVGDMIAEARTRAAKDHVQYLELMITPDLSLTMETGNRLQQFGDASLDVAHFKKWNQALHPSLPELVNRSREELDAAQKRSDLLLGCHTKHPQAGCAVNTRYLYQAIRTASSRQVFTQLSIAYVLASTDPRFVGINFVAPEDASVALKDYGLHMKMFRYFHKLYPKVHLSLHAGELTRDLVPETALKNHIWQAVEVACAERIGHGVDIAGEENYQKLLKKMAQKNILVEINLTSNDEILEIKGKNHPLSLYQRFNVPVSLSTDDEGISRGSLTREYERAVLDQGVSYQDLKGFSRVGLEHAFLSGKGFWEKGYKVGERPVSVCRSAFISHILTEKCQRYLEKNEKAKQEWNLEKRFFKFESKYIFKNGK